MTEEEVKKLLSDIECDFWNLKTNIAYINKKQYHGLSRDLLDYIRDLEKRIDKSIEYINWWVEDNKKQEIGLTLSETDGLLSLLKGDKE